MTKKFSLILALIFSALLMPTFAGAAPYAAYPFFYEDFESGTDVSVAWDNVSSYEIASGGYAGSKASLKVNLGGDGQIMHFPVTLTAGTTYNLSCYIKPEGDVATDELDFIFWLKQKLEDGSEGKEGYRIVRVKNLSFKDGEWTKVTARFSFDGKAALNGNDVDAFGSGKLSIRFGSNGRLSEINGKSSFTYYVDDLAVEPDFKISTVKDKYAGDVGGLIEGGSFEGSKINEAWQQSGARLVSGGANDTAQAVYVGSGAYLKQSVPVSYGHTYYVSGYIKGDEESIGTEASLATDRGGEITAYPIGTLTGEWQSFEAEIYEIPPQSYSADNPLLYIEADGGYYLDEISLKSEKSVIRDGAMGTYWHLNGSDGTVEESSELPEGVFGSSMHITQKSPKRDWAYQYISVKPETEYKLTFWANGVAPLEDSKNVTDYLALPVLKNVSSGSRYEIKDDSLKFETDWKHYEVTFTTAADVESCVQFYIRTSNNYVASEYYLADISLNEVPDDSSGDDSGDSFNTPEIRNPRADGNLINGSTISINAEYLGKNAQTGLIQIFKEAPDGGRASIAMGEFNGADLTYTFTKDDVGQNISYRIVPMDSEGAVGGYRQEQLGAVYDTFEAKAEFLSAAFDEKITAQATVSNRSDSERSVVCMLLLYDSDNACIAHSFKSVNTYFGSDEVITLEMPGSDKCTKAKLFVWEGESDVNTEMTPIIKAVTASR